jgi:hypothetical protein
VSRLGLRIQIGRTELRLSPLARPSRWEVWTSLMAPKLYGFGIWITTEWADLEKSEVAG